MSKDTKNLGHGKVLAWESRGFVFAKKDVSLFDTPSFLCQALFLKIKEYRPFLFDM